LKPLWDSGQLAIIHAAGSPDPTRSHFDAQDYMESGRPGRSSSDGWLNRALPPAGPGVSPVRAIAVRADLPRTLRREQPAVALNNLEQFQVRDKDAAGILETMYARTSDASLMAAGKDAFDAVKMIQSLNRAPYTPEKGVQYAGEFGRGLQQIAKLIKADAGVEAAFCRDRRMGSSHERNASTDSASATVRQLARGIRSGHGRSHGRHCFGHDVRVWQDGQGRWKRWHGSRARERHDGTRRSCSRGQDIWSLARSGIRAIIRTA